MSSHPTFIWRRSSKRLRQGEPWLEYFCIVSLFLAALGLFLIDLDSLPLNNREAVLARLAREIYESSSSLKSWVFPTWEGTPILDRPPLISNLIALAYSLFGVSKFTTRLPGALCGAVSVLILYQIGRELFIARLPALFSASIYLTFLPVVRLGRLATFEGGLLCLEILTIWAILRSRRNLRWTLVAGIAWGAMGLSSGVQSWKILAVALIFLGWDTPRLLGSGYLWVGILLGAAPTSLWYALQWYRHLGAIAITDIWHSLLPSGMVVLGADQTPTELLVVWLQYFFPWCLVIFSGLQSVRQNLHWSWGKLIVAWAGIAILLSLVIADRQLGVVSICPALALAGGSELERIRSLPSYAKYPRQWSLAWGIMTILIAAASLYGRLQHQTSFYLIAVGVALVITLGTASVLILRRDAQFIPLLFWGLYVSLFIFINSPYWIWERAIFEPQPLAIASERQIIAQGETIDTSKPHYSLAVDFSI